MTKSRTVVITFWIVTALFCIEMIFTAYWEWFTPAGSAGVCASWFSGSVIPCGTFGGKDAGRISALRRSELWCGHFPATGAEEPFG